MRALINRLKSDEALMLAYQRGQRRLRVPLSPPQDGLFAFLYRSCPRRAVVEELSQDAWMAVVNSARHYRAEALFRTGFTRSPAIAWWISGAARTTPTPPWMTSPSRRRMRAPMNAASCSSN